MKNPFFTLIAGLLLLLASANARSAEVRVELNKLEAMGDGCGAYLVLGNETDSAFETLKLDLVMFDTEGIVAKRLAVETAPLGAGKTSLKVFGIDGLPCERVGRVLLNDVMACADAAGPRDDCLDLVTPAARGRVEFIE